MTNGSELFFFYFMDVVIVGLVFECLGSLSLSSRQLLFCVFLCGRELF